MDQEQKPTGGETAALLFVGASLLAIRRPDDTVAPTACAVSIAAKAAPTWGFAARFTLLIYGAPIVAR